MNIDQYMQTLGERARSASRAMSSASTGDKNAALLAIARHLETSRSALIEANIMSCADFGSLIVVIL